MDAYLAAILDTRARIFRSGPVVSIHSPSPEIAEALVDHYGVGDLGTYYPETGGRRVFTVWTVAGGDAIDLLTRARPHMKSGATRYADLALGSAKIPA